MAKVTALGWGADGTNALEPDYLEKQEEKWAGIRGSKSSSKQGKSQPKKQAAPQLPAPTTEPPSKRDPRVSSTARGTAGSPRGKDSK